jgi:RHS repeat-associated protein
MVPGYIFTIYSIAVKAELSENSHQGFEGIKAALCLASMEAKSNAASGMPVCLWREGIRSRSSGKERDNETGLDYFGARYYSAAQGRFTSPDPLLGSGRTYDPQTWNRYSYVRNNPLRFTDPTGLDFYDADGILIKTTDDHINYIVADANDVKMIRKSKTSVNAADVHSAIPLPNGDVIAAMYGNDGVGPE